MIKSILKIALIGLIQIGAVSAVFACEKHDGGTTPTEEDKGKEDTE